MRLYEPARQPNAHDHRSACSHLVARGDDQGVGVAPDLESELLRGCVGGLHAPELTSQLLYGLRDVLVPALGGLRHPDAAEALIVGPVAEPSPHLHQGVVHHGVSHEIADHQSLKRQSAGQRESTHRDDVESVLLMVVIVQRTRGPTVDLDHSDRGRSIVQPNLHHGPVEPGIVKLTFPDLVERPDLHIGERFTRWQRAVHPNGLLDAVHQGVNLVAELALDIHEA